MIKGPARRLRDLGLLVGAGDGSGWRESNPHHQLGKPTDRGPWPPWPGYPMHRKWPS